VYWLKKTPSGKQVPEERKKTDEEQAKLVLGAARRGVPLQDIKGGPQENHCAFPGDQKKFTLGRGGGQPSLSQRPLKGGRRDGPESCAALRPGIKKRKKEFPKGETVEDKDNVPDIPQCQKPKKEKVCRKGDGAGGNLVPKKKKSIK